MKVSIQLRQFGKSDAPAKLYFRVRNEQKDLKTSSVLSILPDFWDGKNLCYEKSTPTNIVPKEVQASFNEKVKTILNAIYETYNDEVDFQWLVNIVNSVRDMSGGATKPAKPSRKEAPKSKTAKICVAPKKVKAVSSAKTGKKAESAESALDYFKLYLDSSHFNDWHLQAQTAVMGKVARYEGWLRYQSGKDDFKLYLTYFDKEGTEAYLDYIEHEYELKKQHPDYFSTVKLYADNNIRPMSKNALSVSAKRLFMFLNWCVRNGFLESRAYNNVTLDQEVYGTPYYLTLEERDKIYYADFSYNGRLDYHRDKFMFQCLTGCRHNDLSALTWNHIVGDFIEYIPHKNLLHGKTEVVRCPLCDKAKEILERLDPTEPCLFIKYCEDFYRRDIKTILKAVGIDRMVTVIDPLTRRSVQKPICEVAASHLARRTFIGNLYKQVHDPALISSLTGHATNSKSFERYRAIDDDIKRDILRMIQ